jgi:hypothetical protein
MEKLLGSPWNVSYRSNQWNFKRVEVYSSDGVLIMVDSKGNSVRHLGILRRVLLILGCLLFLGSAIFPFLHEDRHYMIGENLDRNTYWSFKSSTQQIRSLHFPEPVEYWFYDYWVREYADRSELLLVFAFMFVIQILTLIAGTTSVFLNKRILDLAPAILCPMVTALMVYVGTSFRSWEISYQQGYWLTYPSMLLFIAAFTLSLLSHKKKTDLQASKN